MKRLRSKVLTDSARGELCVNCERPDAVFAHLPNVGDAGMAQKADDYWGAYLCQVCHEYADGKGRRDYEWRSRMIHRTLQRMFARGLLVVNSREQS